MVSVSKTAYYYRPQKCQLDTELCNYLKKLAYTHKRWGFDKIMSKIKGARKPWNHKRVYRHYCELGLNKRIKKRRRLPKGEAKLLLQPISKNLSWSMDFMRDSLYNSRTFRTLNVIDDYNREGLLIAPAYSLPAHQVVYLLEVLCSARGYPEMIRVDNGPEFRSSQFKQWAEKNNILIHYIQPGKPAQNGFVERFNRTFREEVLDMNWFYSLQEVKAISNHWLTVYNQERSHESLAGLAPVPFAIHREKIRAKKLENSIFK